MSCAHSAIHGIKNKLTSASWRRMRNVFAVLRVAVSDVEDLKFTAVHKPVRRSFLRLEPGNPYHAEIKGNFKGKPIEKLKDRAGFAIPINPADEELIQAEWDRVKGAG